jgi:outer membrane protein OmpA-like peptidoglycan-associated protein
MASKKLKLIFTFCMFVSAISFAQTGGNNSSYMGGSYNIYDSSIIPNKRMGQQNEFWNNSTSFPAKPRNMWEIGVSTGIFTVSGDVPSVPFTAPNFSVHVRKSFGYIFSLRAQYINTVAKGLQWKAANNFAKNPAWSQNAYFGPRAKPGVGGLVSIVNQSVSAAGVETLSPTQDIVYYNYKTKVQDLGLQGVFTLNNIRFHKQKTGIIIYGGGGIGATLFNARVNAAGDGNGKANYADDFAAIYAANIGTGSTLYKKRKAIRSALKSAMDNTYETIADNENNTRPISGANTLKPSGTVLAGVAFKLGKRINLAIEDRWTFVKTDLLDGQRWQEHAFGDAALTRDFDSYNYASIGLNFNLGGKSTEPLYWLNPLDYAYSELNTPKHMKLPKSECEDNDGDGVCDFLDKEPSTPAGCPVDTHGVTRDTDGDGVPDCKDKQLITPTECQPVDADGVGKCPEPECCKNAGVSSTSACPTDYPSLSFKGNGCSLSNDNKAMLSAVASKMKSSPDCSININGYPAASKAAQANCNCRNEAIKKYLVEKEGISADRISINCDVSDGANSNTVDIKSN